MCASVRLREKKTWCPAHAMQRQFCAQLPRTVSRLRCGPVLLLPVLRLRFLFVLAPSPCCWVRVDAGSGQIQHCFAACGRHWCCCFLCSTALPPTPATLAANVSCARRTWRGKHTVIVIITCFKTAVPVCIVKIAVTFTAAVNASSGHLGLLGALHGQFHNQCSAFPGVTALGLGFGLLVWLG